MSNPGFQPYLDMSKTLKSFDGDSAALVASYGRAAVLRSAGPILIVGGLVGAGVLKGAQIVQERLAARKEATGAALKTVFDAQNAGVARAQQWESEQKQARAILRCTCLRDDTDNHIISVSPLCPRFQMYGGQHT